MDITYEQWQNLRQSGLMSLHPDAKLAYPQDLECILFQGRTLRFKAKTNSLFGPPYATTRKVQRVLIVSKKLAVLESRTFVSDIPYGDRFTVVEKWIVTAEKTGGRYTTKICSSCEAIFDKPCAFEAQIRRNVHSAVKDVCTTWCTMAQDALKLAEKAKQSRLRRKEVTSTATPRGRVECGTVDHSESIEVRHSSTRRIIYVVGEEEKGSQVVLPRSNSAPDLSKVPSIRQRSMSMIVNRRREKQLDGH